MMYSSPGDKGITSMGTRGDVEKTDILVELMGTFDEAQVALGYAVIEAKNLESSHHRIAAVRHELEYMQRALFWLASSITNPEVCEEGKTNPAQLHSPPLILEGIRRSSKTFGLEKHLFGFVLPGGSELAGRIELARVAIRRLEREYYLADKEKDIAVEGTMPLLNRMSTFCFDLARYVNHAVGVDETMV
jgi:cob(I)alamin adenosyltransferase